MPSQACCATRANPTPAPIKVPMARSAAFLPMLPWCCKPPITTSMVTDAHSPWGRLMPVVSRIVASNPNATRTEWIRRA